MNNSSAEILLVEDSPSDIKLALHAFQANSLANQVHVVRDGVEALEFVFGTDRHESRKGASNPKVIFLDLKLPLLDGIEVLRRIKLDPRTRSIPVVIMTASREECDVVDSYELGANSYIIKPVDFDQFTDVIRHLGYYWLHLNHLPAGIDRPGA